MPKTSKVGRNDPCPCGSGRKFKKCCLPSLKDRLGTGRRVSIPKEILNKIAAHQRERDEHLRRFGQVRPLISADFKGHKFVAVGSTVHYGKNWRFFPDFLRDYVPKVVGKDWWEIERAKAADERHPIFQWRTKCIQFMRKQKPIAPGVFRVLPNGYAAAYLTLAYDLYVVKHCGRLDDELLARLMNRDQFQGARHELFAEATCIRAGFTIVHQDQKDPTTKHAEFVAVHKRTGERVAVEAKSRHRPGVLAQPGSRKQDAEIDFRYGRLLNDAIKKNVKLPLAIFLDTNLPPATAEAFFAEKKDAPPIPRIVESLLDRIRREHGGRDPFNMLVFTNHPHHYAAEDEADPKKHTVSVLSTVPTLEPNHPEALSELHEAAALYGNIPNAFPTD